jgi:hypothetical protein
MTALAAERTLRAVGAIGPENRFHDFLSDYYAFEARNKDKISSPDFNVQAYASIVAKNSDASFDTLMGIFDVLKAGLGIDWQLTPAGIKFTIPRQPTNIPHTPFDAQQADRHLGIPGRALACNRRATLTPLPRHL